MKNKSIFGPWGELDLISGATCRCEHVYGQQHDQNTAAQREFVLENVLAHLLQINGQKYESVGYIFYLYQVPASLYFNEQKSPFCFLFNLCIFWLLLLQWMLLLGKQMSRAKVKREQRPRGSAYQWLSRAYDNIYKRRLPAKLISQEVMIIFSTIRSEVI